MFGFMKLNVHKIRQYSSILDSILPNECDGDSRLTKKIFANSTCTSLPKVEMTWGAGKHIGVVNFECLKDFCLHTFCYGLM